jgi:predicted RNA-binding Zn-ribbon protein involved in translation (DUF1610 family)
MSEKSFKTIRNSVIAALIAAGIISIVKPLRSYAFAFAKWLWSIITWCWGVLFASYALPGWAWIIILVLTLMGVVHLCLYFRGETPEPEFKAYTEDYIFGALWRWQWAGNKIFNTWCFCPHCDGQLVYDDSSCRNFLADIKKTNFICENCGQIMASVRGGDKRYAVSAAEREILRRIRTDEYKNALTSQSR